MFDEVPDKNTNVELIQSIERKKEVTQEMSK